MRAVLGNVEEMKRDYPGFEAPPAEYREELRPGDLAELMFLSDQMVPESHWAEVLEIPEPGYYRGILDSGEPVEFGPENVSDIQSRAQMGAMFSRFPWEKEEEKPGKRPSIWDWEAHAAWVDAERARKKEEQEKRGGQPRRSFWDWLRGRPKVELEPIPEDVIRARQPSAPGFTPSSEAPPVVEVPELIVPEEEPVVYGEPVKYGDLLEPEVPEAKPEQGLIIPEVPKPPEVISPVAVFDVLEPAPEQPGGLIVPETRLPAQQEVFGVLEPGPTELTTFRVPSGIVPLEELPGEMKPLEPLEPPSGLIVPETQEAQLFDVLEPQGGLTPYQAPEAAQPFQVVELPPEPFEVEEEQKPKKKRKKKLRMSPRSSISEWQEWIHQTYDLNKVWNHIRSTRENPWFQHEQANEESTGVRANVPIDTFGSGEWGQLFDYLDVPPDEYENYLEGMKKEEEELGYYDQAWEAFQTQVIEPISVQLEAAFEKLQPSDIRGDITLDDDMEGQLYGIVYYEPISDKERERILKKEYEQERQERAQYAERAKEQKGIEKRRAQELRRIWGGLPEADELIPWAEQMFESAFWKSLREKRKLPGWKKEVERAYEAGEDALMELEKIADDGPQLYDQLADYFGIPPDVFQVYFGNPTKDAEVELWEEVLYPYFIAASQAVTAIKPRNIPGYLEFAWDDEEHEFFLKYGEEER